ncbi:MAG: aspartate aminotransferase family protein [Ignavibacteriales bacterium]|nr:aspartate aminotransferase family protein [Ignavibacteriales bacterium]
MSVYYLQHHLSKGTVVADSIFQKENELFFHTYKRLPLDIERGDGCCLIARDGKKYCDFFGGLAVNALGYNHPRINKAIQEQLQKYIHLSNYFVQEPQVKLAERILNVSGYQKLFFTNSGTEAIEGALKLARKWGSKNGKTQLFGLSNSFHGRTMGSLSLTERAKYRDGYEPFLPNIGHLKYNDVDELKANVNEQTLGVVLEFIQGEGGIFVVSPEYASELKNLRDKFGFLIIADEIQSGIGRTGKFLGFEHFDIRPDIVVIAKAIGGGLPLGAFLGSERVAETFTYGTHGTTFGGNPVACAAGLAVLEEVLDNGVMKKAGEIGGYLKSQFVKLQEKFPSLIKEVRGFGCMLGIELTFEGQSVVDALQARGFLVNCTNTNVLRFLPPFIVTRDHCDTLVQQLSDVLAMSLKN